MLEHEGVLLTWELDKPFGRPERPQDGQSAEEIQTIIARRLADHRLAYLQYEGQVSDGRGWVKRVLLGEFHWTNLNERRTAILEFEGHRRLIEFIDGDGDEVQIILCDVD